MTPPLPAILEWAALYLTKLAAAIKTRHTRRQIAQITTAADAMLARLQRPGRGRT